MKNSLKAEKVLLDSDVINYSFDERYRKKVMIFKGEKMSPKMLNLNKKNVKIDYEDLISRKTSLTSLKPFWITPFNTYLIIHCINKPNLVWICDKNLRRLIEIEQTSIAFFSKHPT